MKKRIFTTIAAAALLLALTACGGKTQEETVTGFKPALDTGTSCSITVA